MSRPRILSFDTHPSANPISGGIKKFRQLEPFYKLLLTGFVLLLIAIPLMVNNSFDIRQRAADQAGIEVVDASRKPITQTDSSVVTVQLLSPWEVSTKQTAQKTPTTASIVLAENPAFTRRIQIVPFDSENPVYSFFKFANEQPGEKLVFVKFTSSTGEEKIYSAKIILTDSKY